MKHAFHHRFAARQRGVVLLFSLIALVVLLIAAVALMRSFNSSMFMSGNIAFKRDLQNQGERAMEVALATFRSGNPLDNKAARANDRVNSNYSAKRLPTNAQGIPLSLQNENDLDLEFKKVGIVANDIAATPGVTVRYVIDRMCNTTGDESSLGADVCMLANNPAPTGGSASNLLNADKAPLCPTCSSASPQGVVYRLTVRVSGPRATRSFFQSTFTVPS